MKSDASSAVERVLEVLDRLEIPYLVGGSVASSIFGQSRPTMDLDLVADMRSDRVDEFAEALRSEFYVDAPSILDALRRGRAFNLIHFESTFKIDIFPLKDDEYSRVSFARRRYAESRSFGSNPIECAVASAEDTILRKLEWYRSGGETSERQWNDLRGVLRTSGKTLDLSYLSKWARFLKVDDLLEELLNEEPR
ncbi:MAG: hypothetical protein ABIR70_11520 [Bryobacteraceae bacterium]